MQPAESPASAVPVRDAIVISMIDKLRDHGSWCGQTHLQKTIFFAQAMMRIPLGFDYMLYRYGPFSRELESSIHRLERQTVIAFVPQDPPFGPKLVTSEGAEVIREDEPGPIADYDDALEFIVSTIGCKKIAELERLGTALWFIIGEPRASSQEVADLIHAHKSHVSVAEALDAFEEVVDMGRTARRRGLIVGDGASLAHRPSHAPASCEGERPRDRQTPIVEVASAARPLSKQELTSRAHGKTIFVSSEMTELVDVRRAVAQSLREAGFSVVLFEALGGRDEDAQRAYLTGVARSDIYVGIVANRYGSMKGSGRSSTHEEYREARRLGKRISFWVANDGSHRQGNASDFVQEVQAFHTTGRFIDANDLCTSLLERLAEIAAEEDAPWIKIGQTCFRASRIRDTGDAVVVTAAVNDSAVAYELEDLRPVPGSPGAEVAIATFERAGHARITQVISERRSTSHRELEIHADVRWATGRASSGEPVDVSTGNDLVESELRATLLDQPGISGVPVVRSSRAGIRDPLACLVGLGLSQPTEEAVATLLLCESLVLSGKASRVKRFAAGPIHAGERHVELVYAKHLGSDGREVGCRRIAGVRKA